MNTINPQLICTNCGQLDTVRKVSAIVAEGFSTGESRGVTTGGAVFVSRGGTAGAISSSSNYTTTVTSTVQAQRLVPPPQPRFTFPAVVLIIPLIIGGCLAASMGNMGNIVFGGAVLCAIGLGIFLNNRGQEKLKAEMPLWEKAMSRWNRLYYCARCDGIFDNQDPARRFVPTVYMQGFLRE